MTQRKALFFDIDGTIWNMKNEIPESTVRAIRALREKGHLTFLCSGRSRAFIQEPKLFDIGFDGVISGCGTMIEYHGKTVSYKKLDVNLVEHTIRNDPKRELPTTEIGNIVMDALCKLDQVAYVRFASVYREFKDINTFMQELQNLMTNQQPSSKAAQGEEKK